jgi:multicomponent Na+:H+ antiporter subunit E
MHPQLPIDPQLIQYEFRLPTGTARTFFMNVVNLLPGTLSADRGNDVLTVHVMDVNQPMQR